MVDGQGSGHGKDKDKEDGGKDHLNKRPKNFEHPVGQDSSTTKGGSTSALTKGGS